MTTVELGQEIVNVDKPDKDDLQLWSVTTIIGALDKPALLYWAAQQTAEAAIDRAATWMAMVEDGDRAGAVKWLRDARFRAPKTALSASSLGTIAHAMCEQYALTATRPSKDQVTEMVVREGGDQVDIDSEVDTLGRMLNQFDDWLNRFQPSYQATEVCVYNPTYGYAGQADAFLTIDGVRFIADYKSSRETLDTRGQLRKPYPEQVGLQLAAYRYAEAAAVWRPRRTEKYGRRYYLLSATEQELAVPVPDVDTGLVIKLTPESCESYPIRCDQAVHTAFLYVQEAFRWVQETSKTVMGDPLVSTPRKDQ
ncbi:PD-(D/E)XK nuclease family protein [Mycolicibacterium gilvum]|uniref:PD-(D/E)XK nuclease family protein n=1 Tax=Mycolicibacterium gilvum TaxID=1804 RepID=UPI004045F0EE